MRKQNAWTREVICTKEAEKVAQVHPKDMLKQYMQQIAALTNQILLYAKLLPITFQIEF